MRSGPKRAISASRLSDIVIRDIIATVSLEEVPGGGDKRICSALSHRSLTIVQSCATDVVKLFFPRTCKVEDLLSCYVLELCLVEVMSSYIRSNMD